MKELAPNLLQSPEAHSGWMADVSNNRIKHINGFEMQFTFGKDGTLYGHPVRGFPDLDNCTPEERELRITWLKDTFTKAGCAFLKAVESHLH